MLKSIFHDSIAAILMALNIWYRIDEWLNRGTIDGMPKWRIACRDSICVFIAEQSSSKWNWIKGKNVHEPPTNLNDPWKWTPNLIIFHRLEMLMLWTNKHASRWIWWVILMGFEMILYWALRTERLRAFFNCLICFNNFFLPSPAINSSASW